MILVDSDILIQLSRYDQIAADWLDRQSETTRLSVSVVTEMELVFGSRDKPYLKEVRHFLSRFDVVHIDEAISPRFGLD